MFSPLDQFENIVTGWHIFSFNTTNYTFAWSFLFIFGLLFLVVSDYRLFKITPFQAVVEGWWSLASQIVKQQLNSEQRFTPLFVWTFGCLAFLNLSGLIPYWFTVTGQLSVTFFLSLSFNLGFFYWGLANHGIKFFNLFVPSGAPKALLPLIVVIEIVSYLIRPLSLALRLFANMMAGHASVHILLGFVYLIVSPMILPVGVIAVFTVMLLEFGIALIQAYVFVVLCCIYLQDAISPGH